MLKLNKIARLEFAEAENGGVRSVLKRGYRLRWRKFPTSPVVSWLCLLTAFLLLLTLVAGSGYLLHRYRSALKMAMVVGDAATAAANVAGKAKATVVGAAATVVEAVPSAETLQGLKLKTAEKVDKVGGALKKKWNSLRLKKETIMESSTSATEVAPRTAEPGLMVTSTSLPVSTSTMATSMISTTTMTTTTTTMKAPSPATSKPKSKPPTYPFLMPFFRINSNFPWIWNL